jgi:hypothetical protein
MANHTNRTTQTDTTQAASRPADHCSIRCTQLPKGYCILFHYQPQRAIPLG